MGFKYCVAYNCSMKQDEEAKKLGITFHSFPKDKVRRKQWTLALRRKNYTPGSTATLCSSHFEPKYFSQSGWSSKRFLTSDALPTIFNFPRHLCKSNPTPRKPPAVRVLSEPVNNKTSLKKKIDEVTLSDSDPHEEVGINQQQTNPLDLSPHNCTVTTHEHTDLQHPLVHYIPRTYSPQCFQLKPPNAHISSYYHVVRDFNYIIHRISSDVSSDGVRFPVCSPSSTPLLQVHQDANNVNNQCYVVLDLSMTSKVAAMRVQSIKASRKSFVGDFTLEDMENPVKAKAFYRVVCKVLEEKNRKIRTLAQKNSRFQQKVTLLKTQDSAAIQH